MRLIDADENRESFKKIVYCVLKNDFLTSKDKFNQIMIAFDSIPTAFDVDKVVEKLGKSAKESHGNVGMGGEMVVNLDDAVEIVKQGHVENNEPVNDKCEWRKSKEYPYDWMVGCDGCEVTHKQGAYCPRCGKKIKLVE